MSAKQDVTITDIEGLRNALDELERTGEAHILRAGEAKAKAETMMREHRCPDPEQASYEAQEAFGIRGIWVRHWGATMILADFYVIVPIAGSKREVAVKLHDIEYGPFGEQRTVPTPIMSAYECHEVRVVGGEPQARFNGKYETLHLWNGKPQVINTLD